MGDGADRTPDEDGSGWVGVGDGDYDAVEEECLLLGLLRLMTRLSVVEGVQSLLCPAQNVRECID